MDEGYYWVKYATSPNWRPSFWDGENSWLVNGYRRPLEYYSIIGPKIEKPEEDHK